MEDKESIQSKGGFARAKALTEEERKASAINAAASRWGLPVATHAGELVIVDLSIPCYVLKDGRRMLSQSGLIGSLGMSRGSSRIPGGDRLTSFAHGKTISPFISKQLLAVIQGPTKFVASNVGIVHGYEATLLADLCDAVLAARKAGSLQTQQLHIADQCEILVRGFARIGIVSLVDEATGYQEVRDRKALQAILEKFLTKEFAAWAKRFPDAFYEQMFRLKGWQWKGMTVRRPSCIGHYTNDLVYDRLAPGILTELKNRNPVDEKGYRKTRHHQWLTPNIGHPALSEHIHALVALMKVAKDWDQFRIMVDTALPKKGETLCLPI